MGQIRGADKPGPNVASDSPPSLLSSFAGLLEGGVLSVFSSSVAEKKSTQQQQQRVGSLQTIPLNHVETSTAADGGVASKKNSSSSSSWKSGSSSAKHLKLTRPPSEPTSENDMPGLERLERSTCAASSEDEARPEAPVLAALQVQQSQGAAFHPGCTVSHQPARGATFTLSDDHLALLPAAAGVAAVSAQRTF